MKKLDEMTAYFPIEEALALIQKFENHSLPKNEWTHELHLMTGLYYSAKYGEEALPRLREKIKSYNQAVGTINSESSGYHETMTHFWLFALRQYCAKDGLVLFDQETLDDMLWTEELADRNLWLTYYSKEFMMSTEVRMNLLQGNILPVF